MAYNKMKTSLAKPETPWDERAIVSICSCCRHTVFPKGVAEGRLGYGLEYTF